MLSAVLDSIYCLYEKPYQNVNWTTVVCAIIEKDNTFLCCQRSKKMKLPLQWEFPGGKIEKGESLASALARELHEELNLEVMVGDVFETSLHQASRVKLVALRCDVVNLSSLILNEHSALKWLPKGELHTLNWAEADLPIIKKLSSE
jgi:8-oxo-dGTP diphosphatase